MFSLLAASNKSFILLFTLVLPFGSMPIKRGTQFSCNNFYLSVSSNNNVEKNLCPYNFAWLFNLFFFFSKKYIVELVWLTFKELLKRVC